MDFCIASVKIVIFLCFIFIDQYFYGYELFKYFQIALEKIILQNIILFE